MVRSIDSDFFNEDFFSTKPIKKKQDENFLVSTKSQKTPNFFKSSDDDLFLSPNVQKDQSFSGIKKNVIKKVETEKSLEVAKKIFFLDDSEEDDSSLFPCPSTAKKVNGLFDTFSENKENQFLLFGEKKSESEVIDFFSAPPTKKNQISSSKLFDSSLIQEEESWEVNEKRREEQIKTIEQQIRALYSIEGDDITFRGKGESFNVSLQELLKDLRNNNRSQKIYKIWTDKSNLHVPTYIAKKIGKGGFAKIYLVLDLKEPSIQVFKKAFAEKMPLDELSGKFVRLAPEKYLAAKAKADHDILNEYKILNRLNEKKTVLGLQEKPHSYETSLEVGKTNKRGFFGVKYQGNFDDVLKTGKERTLKENLLNLLQLTSGINYLHSPEINIIHGDIKFSNIFVKDDGSCVLGDFGGAVECDEPGFLDKINTNAFTPEFTSLEDLAQSQKLIENKDDAAMVSLAKKQDIFSLGIIFYQLLVKKAPFDFYQYSKHPILETFRPIPSDLGLPEELKHLIESMLNSNPAARPKADQIFSTLTQCIEWLYPNL